MQIVKLVAERRGGEEGGHRRRVRRDDAEAAPAGAASPSSRPPKGRSSRRRPSTKITAEQQATNLMKAKYDVDRAKLDLGKRDLVSRIEFEGAKLSLGDAEQRLKEVEAKALSIEGRRRRRAARQEAQARQGAGRRRPDRRRRSRRCGCARRPTAPSTSSRTRARANMFGGGGVEFREGDRAWAGRQHPRAARPVVDPSRGAARRVRSRPPEGRPDRLGQDRGGARQGLRGDAST